MNCEPRPPGEQPQGLVEQASLTLAASQADEEHAARVIQLAAFPRLFGHRNKLNRQHLIYRLELELELLRGLRLLVLCASLFAIVTFSTIHEKQNPTRLGLRKMYAKMFQFDDVADIKTRDDFLEYMRVVSRQSRLMQPVSSLYFIDESGEIKVEQGLSRFFKPSFVEVTTLKPRIDSTSWTISAWVQLTPGQGANILRKPLGKSPDTEKLTCWGWHVGAPFERFDFGAHDYRGGSALLSSKQESVVGTQRSKAADGSVRFVAVVANFSHLSFWTDGKMQSEHKLPRPVTDCTGLGLQIGDYEVPLLGDITFFPRALTQQQMDEIMFAGFTLQSLALGKESFSPPRTPTDKVLAMTDTSFAVAASERAEAERITAVEGSLGRSVAQKVMNPAPVIIEPQKINVAKNATCRRVIPFGADTSCRFISNWTGAAETDDDGMPFLNLLPPAVRPPGVGGREPIYLDQNGAGEYIRYDPSTFPDFCGQSATFSLWIETDTLDGGYFLTRYGTSEKVKPLRWWGLYAEAFGLYVYGFNAPSNADLPGSEWGRPFEFMKNKRRHMAFVFDHLTDKTHHYVDGKLLGTTQHPAGTISKMDCEMSGQDSYIGLGHRIPGAYHIKGPLQDWRYYRGRALSAEQIFKIAFNTAQRTCELSDEGGDTDFKDSAGKDCAWYQDQRNAFPEICSTQTVRRECALACGSKAPCWEGTAAAKDNVYSIWNRVIHLTEHTPGAGVICGRMGVDLVENCRANARSPDTSPAPGATGWEDIGSLFGWRSYMDIDVKNCDVLAKVVHLPCAFDGGWTKQINSEIKAGGGYTIEFWWKAVAGTKIPLDFADYETNADSMRRMVFFSKLSPPRVILTIEFRSNQMDTLMAMYGTCSTTDSEAMDVKGQYKTGVWYRMAAVLGAKNADGKVGQVIMQGSAYGFDFADWGWCLGDDSDFIEAIQLPGGVLMSPIHITPRPLAVKPLQEKYYTQKNDASLLRGPQMLDEEARAKARISYVRPTFSYPAALVSPPLVLQERLDKTAQCKNSLGTLFQKSLWARTVEGETCSAPYDCGDLLSDSRLLMSCSLDQPAPSFLGQTDRVAKDGALFYPEFLQSITDAPILSRGNETAMTNSYIDFQTKKIVIQMVAFSPEYGIASDIDITANFGSDVSVDFRVRDIQSIEGDRLTTYTWYMASAIIVSFLILLDKVFTANFKRQHGREVNKIAVLIEIAIQVVLPISYFAIRFTQLKNSEAVMNEIMGDEGLSGVPWASHTVSRKEKLSDFFTNMEKLEAQLQMEYGMQIFYFILATAELWRLIIQTEAHPRTAILVKTLRKSFDELLHFLYLFVILLAGYMGLAVAQFAGDKAEFSIERCFETLWEMMMGSMIDSGSTPSQYWSSDPLVLVYQLTYSMLLFLIMLNFIIAIIVESYDHVKNEARKIGADQELFTDIFSVLLVTAKSIIWRWPNHREWLIALEEPQDEQQSIVNYRAIRSFFPRLRTRPKSILAFQQHYRHLLEVIDMGEQLGIDEQTQLKNDIVQELEERMAMMLGVVLPTSAERQLESDRLATLGLQKRHKKEGKKIMGRTVSTLALQSLLKDKLDRPLGPSCIIRDPQVYNSGAGVANDKHSRELAETSALRQWSTTDVKQYVASLTSVFGPKAHQYATTCAAQDIDGIALAALEDKDLSELGFSVGHRKHLLQSIDRLKTAGSIPGHGGVNNDVGAADLMGMQVDDVVISNLPRSTSTSTDLLRIQNEGRRQLQNEGRRQLHGGHAAVEDWGQENLANHAALGAEEGVC